MEIWSRFLFPLRLARFIAGSRVSQLQCHSDTKWHRNTLLFLCLMTSHVKISYYKTGKRENNHYRSTNSSVRYGNCHRISYLIRQGPAEIKCTYRVVCPTTKLSAQIARDYFYRPSLFRSTARRFKQNCRLCDITIHRAVEPYYFLPLDEAYWGLTGGRTEILRLVMCANWELKRTVGGLSNWPIPTPPRVP